MLIVIALGIGLLMYRTKIGLGPASIVGIVLMLLSVWWSTGHPYALAEEAMIWNIWGYIKQQNWILAVVGSVILLAGMALIALSYGSFKRAKEQPEQEPEVVAENPDSPSEVEPS